MLGRHTTSHDLVRQGRAKNKDWIRIFFGLVSAFLFSTWTLAFADSEKVEAYELPALSHSYEEEKATRFFTALFDSEFPITAKPSRWSFRYNVKAEDIIDKPYLRMPLEGRYGLTPPQKFPYRVPPSSRIHSNLLPQAAPDFWD